jgi:two-component system response regulator YesN
MLKLLIVEDENKTREALKSCINWSELGFDKVGDVSNGSKALQFIQSQEFVPNLVITDIRMPEMDGIELVSILNRDYPETVIIIISAYSDMSYLKSAIKYHAVDYIFKPVNIPELEQAVRLSVERIHSNEKRKQALHIMEDNLVLLKDKWLRSITNGIVSADIPRSVRILRCCDPVCRDGKL